MKRYKIMEIAYDKKCEKAEQLMNEMSEQGWEVVSVSSDFQRSVKLLITFCRDELTEQPFAPSHIKEVNT